MANMVTMEVKYFCVRSSFLISNSASYMSKWFPLEIRSRNWDESRQGPRILKENERGFFYSSKCRLPVLLPHKFVHNKSLSGLSFSLTLSKKTEIKGRVGRGGSNWVQNYAEYFSLPTPELFHSQNFVPTQFQEVETEREITFHLKVDKQLLSSQWFHV